MQPELPLVTIIIPTRPGETEPKAVSAARQLDYPPDRKEIIVARGRQPSVQRNRAAAEARGEIIYFLDDDALPLPEVLRRAVERFNSDASVQMVGGPNLCPPGAPFLEQVFAVVLSSWIAFGPSRARYARVGEVRVSGEKELILCNLLTRRTAFYAAGGFDEALYPNEENALMDELQRRGGKLIYDPDLVALRRPRSNLNSFIRMLMTYGRGRAEQVRLHPSLGSAANFVPPLFVAYLLMAPFTALLGGTAQWLAGLPALVYSIALLAQTAASVRTHGARRSLCALPMLFATHVFYGLGFWRGLFTRLRKREALPVEVTLERITG